MDRMAQNTKQPEVLRELFKALGNDPFVIAECLAKPVLSERLATNFYPHDQRFHAGPMQRAEAQHQVPTAMAAVTANYRFLGYRLRRLRCTDDTSTPTSTTNAPDARCLSHGSMDRQRNDDLGGRSRLTNLSTGGRYYPSTDSWTPPALPARPPPNCHTAVWTGSEMIVGVEGISTPAV